MKNFEDEIEILKNEIKYLKKELNLIKDKKYEFNEIPKLVDYICSDSKSEYHANRIISLNQIALLEIYKLSLNKGTYNKYKLENLENLLEDKTLLNLNEDSLKEYTNRFISLKNIEKTKGKELILFEDDYLQISDKYTLWAKLFVPIFLFSIPVSSVSSFFLFDQGETILLSMFISTLSSLFFMLQFDNYFQKRLEKQYKKTLEYKKI